MRFFNRIFWAVFFVSRSAVTCVFQRFFFFMFSSRTRGPVYCVCTVAFSSFSFHRYYLFTVYLPGTRNIEWRFRGEIGETKQPGRSMCTVNRIVPRARRSRTSNVMTVWNLLLLLLLSLGHGFSSTTRDSSVNPLKCAIFVLRFSTLFLFSVF